MGQVVAPSGAVVLACSGFLDEWAELGEPLSVRAGRVAAAGGAHLQDWLAEAVAVPAGQGPVTVTALTRAGVYEAVDTIAVLDIDLGLPWPAVSTGSTPIVLGDLPVELTGMVIGDAAALDSWVGFVRQRPPIDGLADLMVWGKGGAQARQHFDVPAIPTLSGCPILCIAWTPSELQRFNGGRPFGQAYPLTLEPVEGRAVLRWAIPPHADTA